LPDPCRRAILGDGQLLPFCAILDLGLFWNVTSHRTSAKSLTHVYQFTLLFLIVVATAGLTAVAGSLSLACDSWYGQLLPDPFRWRAVLGDGQLLPDPCWRAILGDGQLLPFCAILDLRLFWRYVTCHRTCAKSLTHVYQFNLLTLPFLIVDATAGLTTVAGSLSLACDSCDGQLLPDPFRLRAILDVESVCLFLVSS
jgi:hypothetical protein